MSIVHCNHCDRQIDLDYNVEHFVNDDFTVCINNEDALDCPQCDQQFIEGVTDDHDTYCSDDCLEEAEQDGINAEQDDRDYRESVLPN